uniref:Uncharacterized protein n=1 Tax=Arundo donax TaxID=35708 RepID=A0A0A9AFN1_ARUDO
MQGLRVTKNLLKHTSPICIFVSNSTTLPGIDLRSSTR